MREIKVFFDEDTYTLTYVVWCAETRQAVIIDSVLNYDLLSSKISTSSLDGLLVFLAEQKLTPVYVLETHAHADHLTAAQWIKKHFPSVKTAVGQNIVKVQQRFQEIFNLKNLPADGSQFDVLLNEQEELSVGSFNIKTLFTPGHTPACTSFLIGDALFTGDAIFMPDYGTGRCDFPDGSAEDLYDSITKKIYTLDDSMRVFVGHDYQPGGRDLVHESTVGKQKQSNIHLKGDTSKQEFVDFRTRRDQGLNPPRLLYQSIQFNITAGQMPVPEDNGMSYFKLPVFSNQ